jgi:cation-transporting P-type ATPase C
MQVLAQTPGRVRLGGVLAPFGSRARRLAHALEDELGARPGIRGARADFRTGNVLVTYDPARLTAAEVPALLGELLDRVQNETAPAPCHDHGQDGCNHHEHDHDSHDHDHDHESCGHHHETQLSAAVGRLVLGGAVLAGMVIRRLIIGRPAAPSLPLQNLGGVMAIATGYPFFRSAFRALSGEEKLTTDTLISVATIASIVMRESITGLIVIWLLNLGELLQMITLRRTRRAIEELLAVGEAHVRLITSEGEAEIELAELRAGDRIAVYTGERISVDGRVYAGGGAVNEAPVTGESIPVYKNVGDEVFAGTIVVSGALRVEATRVGADTTVGRLIRRVEEAVELRAPIQTVGERFASKFVPISFFLSAAVLVVTGDFRRSMTMLLIACPCAAGLATPTAVSAAIGNGARRGILIKGGTHLESIGEVDTVLFDKTGTLTLGNLCVTRIVTLTPIHSPAEILGLAASGGLHSRHPMSLAIVEHTREREIVIPEHETCEIIVGRGMRADMTGTRLLVGNAALLDQYEVTVTPDARAEAAVFAARGEAVLYVARDERLIGMIGVADAIRPEAMQALRDLRHVGVNRLMMITGDIAEAADVVARQLDLTEFHSQVMPEGKFAIVRRLQAEGHHIAMVGDGINDGPALAMADVGIAMGAAGSDVAIEAADIALAGSDIRQVASVIRLGRRAVSVIRQNYALAIGVNSLGILIGAAGWINPFLAALLHNLSTVAVVLSSSRLIGYRDVGVLAERGLPSSMLNALPPTSLPEGIRAEESSELL